MAGALFEFDVDGSSALLKAQRRLGRVTRVIENDLGEAVAEMLEDQTRKRILEEKRAPDGRPWDRWSKGYQKRRQPETVQSSGLVESHDLEESIEGTSKGTQVSVLADTIYAAVHQYGYKHTPARPYLGISTENAAEIQDLVREMLEDAIEELGSAHTKHGRAIRSTPGRIV